MKPLSSNFLLAAAGANSPDIPVARPNLKRVTADIIARDRCERLRHCCTRVAREITAHTARMSTGVDLYGG